jgi:diphthamide synthase (EF-2-diphthine--ammonia ligase)
MPPRRVPARAVLSWSGGKDACLAWLRARASGLDVTTFLTMCEADGDSLSHALPREWLARQVAAFGVAWRAVDVPRETGGYAAAFEAALSALRADGHTHAVFGDIDLVAHRDWIVPRVEAAGLVAVFPLWGVPRVELAAETVARGIRARIVAVDLGRAPASLCGADYGEVLRSGLPEGVCPCGEDGEFHTAVTFAPGMVAAVPLADVGVVVRASSPPLSPTLIARLAFAREGAPG